MKRILLLAGEESGVLYAKRIAEKLRSRFPQVDVRGYRDYGFETADLAVFGYFAVLRRLFFFLRVKRTMERAIDTWQPEVVCTVDYPGLNLKLAAYAKAHGCRAVHVVCPQVWAWHQGRIPAIEASLDHLCCFFPFEPALFKPGFATFVGHPLASDIFAAPERSDASAARTVALLPGSRLGEIERILPTLLKAADLVSDAFPDLRFLLPAAHAKARAVLTAQVAGRANMRVTDGRAREALAQAVCAVVASGTATLEAALAHCPTVLVYRVGAVTAWIARRVITGVRHVGLANIIAEKASLPCPMPELLQENFTAEAVAAHLKKWLADDQARSDARRALDQTTALLKSSGDPIDRIVRTLAEH